MRSTPDGLQFATLVDLLQYRAAERGGGTLFTFLEDSCDEGATLTFSELDLRARAIAAELQERGRTGDRALLLYPPGLEFVAGFFGCLYAGVVPVPAYPPRPGAKVARIGSILANARPSLVLGTAEVVAAIRDGAAGALGGVMQVVSTDIVPGSRAAEWSRPKLGAEALAFLQYTSGSTSEPKGVMVTHRNLLHNSEYIRSAFELTSRDVSVCWLPSYHDMGLIDGILQPVYSGLRGYIMSPAAFLQHPARWLQAISRYRGSHCGGPDFAYALAVARTTPEERAELDLGCWRSAYNGAEPVRAETLERFARAFAPCGFHPRFFYPCYGLAEATLMVTGGLVGDDPVEVKVATAELERDRVAEWTPSRSKAARLVGSGRVHLDTRVVIVDPATRIPCPPDRVGEVWVSGASVAAGYWENPEATEETFGARIAGTGKGPFLRTGDLGFLRHGELFVTGRLKDMFILRGRNHYPQDVELTVERSHRALRAGCGAAFTITGDETDQLVVLQEVERAFVEAVNVDEVAAAVRRAVAAEHELHVTAVVLLRTGSILKTSSGKIQRRACRAEYLAGTLAEVGRSLRSPSDAADAPRAPAREELLALGPGERRERVLEHVLAVLAAMTGSAPADVPARRPLLELGLDSLGATRLKLRLESDLGVRVPVAHLLQENGAAALAQEIGRLLEEPQAPSVSAGASAQAGDQPLSRGQQALWFLHRLAPHSAAYNVAYAARIRSGVDPETLRRALQRLTDRHSALRTSIVSVEGRPVQRVAERTAADFRVVDAAGWSAEALDAVFSTECQRPFDLREGPLLRAVLYTRGPGEDVLLLTAHHVVVDFRSAEILLDELRRVYASLRAGGALTFPPPGEAPADHARAEVALLDGPEGERQWRYWSERLAGLPPALELPRDRPAPAVRTFRGGVRRERLDPAVVAQLRRLARQAGATPYMVLLAAFQAQLRRYSHSDDVVVGTSAEVRGRASLAGSVGYFVNQLVLRTRLDGDPSFAALVERVRETVVGALSHADLPFPLLVERLAPQRDAFRSPLFQVMFSLQRPHTAPAAEEGLLELEPLALEHGAAQFDLNLTLVDEGGGMTVVWEYDHDLFDAETVERMCGHYRTLLAAAVADPGRRVRALPLLADDERRLLLKDWNRTAREMGGGPVHECFARHAASTPDAPAIIEPARTLSYAELNAAANRLAHHLVRRGVARGSRVGVSLPRSAELVTTVLATLKAGAAYVPLDPVQPRLRLAGMSRDAGVSLLICGTEHAPDLAGAGVEAISMEALEPELTRESADDPAPLVGPDDLAYVIYTSGSTGTPKGVMVTHVGLANYLAWSVDAYAVAGGTGSPVNTSIGFDATVTSLFAPLMAGRTVTLLPEADELRALADALASGEAFSLVKLTPAHLEVLRGLVPADARIGARAFVVGGEPLSPATVAYWRARAPETRIVNEYGPTEAVVGCCVHEVVEEAFPSGVVPIGRPIANTRVYVLDGAMEPVPVGVTGELCVGGAGVARGYLGRSALTAERFLPDPFGEAPGARLYRTGDHVRYRRDGTLEFLGRRDGQVKVRGFRVELAEVASAIRVHPGVRASAVDARPGPDGTLRLVAWLVPGEGLRGAGTELRAWLENRLPAWMIPARFVEVDALPLNVNGKVDRAALREPAGSAAARPAGAPPGTVTQRLVAEVWRKVLRRDEVGVDDNFFDLGGHSLLAAEAAEKLQERLGGGREIAVLDLLRHPTVAALARHIDGGSGGVTEFRGIRDRVQRQRQAAGRRPGT